MGLTKTLLQKWGLINRSESQKKVFLTTWSEHRFADDQREKTTVVLPDDISFSELSMLPGLKTRVTIEVLPW